MILKKYKVENFRSVLDSGWIDCDNVTTLVGINEAGKSNLLLALWKLNPAREGNIDILHDMPVSKLSTYRKTPEEVKFITAEFELDDDAIKRIEDEVQCSLQGDKLVTVTRFYDGNYTFEFPSGKPQSTKTEKVTEEVKKDVGPKPVFSGYSEFYADIDKGQKILCFFVPGCEHCRDAARDLNALQKKHKDFPQVQIVFMDEESEKIPDFFKYAGKQFPYKVIDVIPFWTKLGSGKDTPGVVYLHNGNLIKFYDGIAEKAFNSKALEKVIYK